MLHPSVMETLLKCRIRQAREKKSVPVCIALAIADILIGNIHASAFTITLAEDVDMIKCSFRHE